MHHDRNDVLRSTVDGTESMSCFTQESYHADYDEMVVDPRENESGTLAVRTCRLCTILLAKQDISQNGNVSNTNHFVTAKRVIFSAVSGCSFSLASPSGTEFLRAKVQFLRG